MRSATRERDLLGRMCSRLAPIIELKPNPLSTHPKESMHATVVSPFAARLTSAPPKARRFWNSLPELAGSLTKPIKAAQPTTTATVTPAKKGSYSSSSSSAKLFQVTLIKGLKGLPATTKAHVQALGLYKRFQVVWHCPSPEAVGNILRIKELVHLNLIEGNVIPPKPTVSPGFTVTRNVMMSRPLA